jgi:drug/metabolite transporter (DMT)-like permease
MMTQDTTLQDNTRRFRGELVLCLVTLIWGTTFITIQDAMDVWPPMANVGMRFGIAFLCLAPLLVKVPRDRRDIVQGIVLGFSLFTAFAMQTLSLVYTTAARTAFAAALVTVFVPLFALLALRIKWKPGTYFAVCSGGLGIFLLMGRELGPGARFGDFLGLAAAAGFAVQVMLLGHFTRRPNVHVVTMLVSQMGTVTILAWLTSWGMSEELPNPFFQGMGTVLYLGIVTTALCFLGQMYGQTRTTPTRAAFIYALEPIAAAAFAWVVHGQRLSSIEWIGGSLIVLAAVTADQALPARLRYRSEGEAESPLQSFEDDLPPRTGETIDPPQPSRKNVSM